MRCWCGLADEWSGTAYACIEGPENVTQQSVVGPSVQHTIIAVSTARQLGDWHWIVAQCDAQRSAGGGERRGEESECYASLQLTMSSLLRALPLLGGTEAVGLQAFHGLMHSSIVLGAAGRLLARPRHLAHTSPFFFFLWRSTLSSDGKVQGFVKLGASEESIMGITSTFEWPKAESRIQ